MQIPAFKVVSVFDVSQTEGEPLPSIAVSELSGSVQDYQDFFKALEQASPVPIGFEDIEGGAHGYFHLLDNRIAIQEGMSQLQTIKTAIHEIAPVSYTHLQYDEKYCKWRYEDLPILPQPWQFIVPDEKKQQFEIVRALLNRPDVDLSLIHIYHRQSAQPVVPDPCGGPDHEHPVHLHLPCDLRPHD